MNKNAIFIFKKIPIKRTKYIYIYDCFRHFFFIFYFVFLKKIKKIKVGQKLSKKVGSLSSIIPYFKFPLCFVTSTVTKD